MATPQEYRDFVLKAYREKQAEFDARIENGIEQNRKGDCKIRFTDANGKPLAGKTVKITQKKHDFKYGAHIFMLDELENEQQNTQYRQLFKEYFNLATVPFYWDGLEPERGKPRYAKDSPKIYRRPAPDLCLEYCNESGIDAKLHCMVYDKFVPQWLIDLPPEEVNREYEKRFQDISARYAGKMMEFEVINETLEMQWWKQHTSFIEGNDLVEKSFRLAKKYLPNETLVINDGAPIQKKEQDYYYNKYYLQIKGLLASGVPIDKIGMQNHMYSGVQAHNEEEYAQSVYADWAMLDPGIIFKWLDIFAEFGLPLELTEVTVPTFGETEADEELQADLLKMWYSIWFSHPAVNTVVYWNTVDGHAYYDPNWIENNCRGGLFHHDLTPKKSGKMLYDLFHKVWHTDLELTTDENGYAQFRGFYGDYTAETENAAFDFGVHKNEKNCIVFECDKEG